MANYNTFIVVNCNTRKPILTTSSAKKSYNTLDKGYRVEIWNNNELVKIIYNKNKKTEFEPYIALEKEYHRQKQLNAEQRNKLRKERRLRKVS